MFQTPKAAHCAPPPLEAAEMSFVWSYKDRNIFLALKTTPEEVELKQKYNIVQKRICFLAIHFLFGDSTYTKRTYTKVDFSVKQFIFDISHQYNKSSTSFIQNYISEVTTSRKIFSFVKNPGFAFKSICCSS